MDRFTGATRAYYEAEARERLRGSPRGRRLDERQAFIDLLRAEGRHHVLDIGAGPATDGDAFIEAGLTYTGLDLAHGNAVLARAKGLCVVQGSLTAPPFRPETFDAGWCMSVLMHLERKAAVSAVEAMAAALRPGSPMVVGIWGGDAADRVDREGIVGHERLFAHRPVQENRELLASIGLVEHESIWAGDIETHEYHLFRVRIG